MPEQNITIQGEAFVLKAPYEPGHTLTEVEAKVLNRTWCENVANNCRKVVKEGADEANTEVTIEAARKKVAEYAAKYEFSLAAAGGSRASLTPEQKEARKMAREFIMAKLKKEKRKYKDESDESKENIEAKIIEISEREAVLKAAKKRLADKAKMADELFGDAEAA